MADQERKRYLTRDRAQKQRYSRGPGRCLATYNYRIPCGGNGCFRVLYKPLEGDHYDRRENY